jgi:imidazoleglycerol-phosphate dehydratase
MWGAFAKHGRFDVKLTCKGVIVYLLCWDIVHLLARYPGDLWIDDHHTAEDTALALGEAFDKVRPRNAHLWKICLVCLVSRR